MENQEEKKEVQSGNSGSGSCPQGYRWDEETKSCILDAKED